MPKPVRDATSCARNHCPPVASAAPSRHSGDTVVARAFAAARRSSSDSRRGASWEARGAGFSVEASRGYRLGVRALSGLLTGVAGGLALGRLVEAPALR